MAAAVEVLAQRGPRGFTHRAVDAQAGLGQGAVNYHAPSRSRLLSLALEEVFRRDLEVIAEHFALADWAPRTVVAALTRFFTTMTTGTNRPRVIARHHLRGEAVTNPEVRATFDAQHDHFLVQVTTGFAAAGNPIDRARAELFVIAVEGVLARQVLSGSAPLPDALVEDIAWLFVDPNRTV